MLVYLDNSATTRPYDAVTAAMTEAMKDNFGNPSSLHSLGLQAEKEVKNARKTVAKCFGAGEDEIYFTSCGTESDNTVLMGTAQEKKRKQNNRFRRRASGHSRTCKKAGIHGIQDRLYRC